MFLVILILSFFYLINKKRKYLNFLIIHILILLFIAFIPIGNFGLSYLEKDFFNQKQFKNIKNILVLSGSDERIISSIKIANIQTNSKIYYIGGNGYMIKNNQNNEHMLARNLYKSLNFDLGRVKFVGNSRNTIENFKEIKKLDLDNLNTILITSAYHMKRALMIAKNEDLNFRPHAVDFRSFSQKSLINRYQVFSITNNLSNFNLCFREILGIIAFKIST